MNILIIHGSPRQGNTLKLIERFKTAMSRHGEIRFEMMHVHEQHLRLCRGCFTCVTKGEHLCPLKDDDLTMVVEKMDRADGVIIAAPTYMYSVPAVMKNLIDRLAYLGHRPRYADRYAVVLSTTCEKGLKEALKFLSLGTAWAWGHKLVGALGVETHPFFQDTARCIRNEKRIRKLADAFYSAVNVKKAVAVNFEDMMRFRAMFKHAIYSREIFPADYEFYTRCNESNNGYFVKNYTIHAPADIASKVLSEFVGRAMNKCRDRTDMEKVFS